MAISIPPYIYMTHNEHRTNIPDKDVLLVRVFYRRRLKLSFLPKFVWDDSIKRESFEMPIYDIPMLLSFSDKELKEYMRFKLCLGEWYIITKVKILHTIGGTNKRFSTIYTNHSDIPRVTLRTESTIDLLSKLPDSLTYNAEKTVIADMSGLFFDYALTCDPVKLFNYLKLVNFYGDVALKEHTLLIVPYQYVSIYDFK